MGVGVYSNDFLETGGTFLVDGPDVSDEAYEAYCQSEGEDGETPMEQDVWAQFEVGDESARQDEVVSEALRRVGFSLGAWSSRDYEHDFKVHSRDQDFVVGLRGWECDTVVGVWQNDQYGRYQGSVNGDIVEMALASGVEPERLCDLRRKTVDALLELIRLELQENGFVCRYKTSGYTTGEYPRLEDEAMYEARRAELVAQVQSALELVRRPFEQALREEGPENFLSIIQMIVKEEPGYYRDAIKAGFICRGDDGVLFGELDDELKIGEWTSSGALTVSQLGLSPEFAEGSDLCPLPETDDVLKACIEQTIKFRQHTGQWRFLLPPQACARVLDISGEVVPPLYDDESDDEPDSYSGPGM